MRLGFMQKLVAGLFTLAIVVSFSGCTGMGGGSETVSATDNQFTPNSKSVKQNTDMSWRNDGNNRHSVSIHKVGDAVTALKKDTDIEKSASTNYKFEETGTYHVYCKYHSSGTAGSFGNGMVMTVTVT